MSIQFTVFGNGAVGCFLAGRMFRGFQQQQGFAPPVSLVCREGNKHSGSRAWSGQLRVMELDGRIESIPLWREEDVASLPGVYFGATPWRWKMEGGKMGVFSGVKPNMKDLVVLIATKSFDTKGAVTKVWDALCCNDDGAQIPERIYLLSVSNGLGNAEAALETWNGLRVANPNKKLGNAVVGQGLVYDGIKLEAPNYVRHTGRGKGFYFGLMNSADSSKEQALVTLQDCLKNTGMNAVRVENEKILRNMIWTKLLVNSVINPLTALYRIPNGQIGTRESLQPVVRRLCSEFDHLSSVVGVNLELDGAISSYDFVIKAAQATEKNTSSMLQDVLLNRQTEIEFITGSLLREARKFNITIPTHEEIYRQVLQIHPTIQQVQ